MQKSKPYINELTALCLGVMMCFTLKYFGLSSVLSSACAGLAGSLIYGRNYTLQSLLYCGTFIAMTNKNLESIGFYAFAVIISYGFFHLLRSRFTGLGGKLGMLAFIGTLMASIVVGSL